MNNETGSMRGREISLLDLIVDILLHWRSIIAVMLVGGILMGAFSYVRSVQSVEQQLASQKGQQVQQELSEEELRGKLTEEQLVAVDIALIYYKLYEQYVRQVDYINADAFAVYTAQLIFWVDAEEAEPEFSYNVATVYKNMILGEVFAGEDADALTKAVVKADQGQDSNVLQVTVKSGSEDDCKEVAAAVAAYVEEQHRKLADVLGDHEVTLLSQSVEKVSEEAILSNQRSYIDKVSSFKNTCATLVKAFSEDEAAYFDYLLAQGDEGEETEAPDTEGGETAQAVLVPGVSIKYVALGMILFAFVAVFVIFLLYILNNKLRLTDHFQEIYGISHLGSVKCEKGRKVFGFVDSLILKLRYRGKRQFSKEESVKLAVVAVKMTVKKAEAAAVCLMGCNLKEDALGVCDCIQAALEKEGVSVKVLNNVLYDAEAMKELTDVQSAVLVETAGSTMYDEIASEAELLVRQNINVLGGIVVG